MEEMPIEQSESTQTIPDAGVGTYLQSTPSMGEKKPRRVKSIPIRLIRAERESVLVEWDDDNDVRRAYVPVSEVTDGKCPADVLAAGIPYGTPWEDFITVNSVHAVACALRKYGFWTSDDIEQRPQRAQAVINAALGVSAAHLHGAAKEYEEVRE